MKLITILLTLLLMSQNGICSIRRAGKCLKDLEHFVLYSSYDDEWHGVREYFLFAIDQVTHISHMDALLRQLRFFENHIKYSRKRDSWNQWERQYWKVLTDPDINVKHTITRFITTLKLMEENLLSEALNDKWVESKRNEWLWECGALVDSLLKVSFYDEMFLNVGAMLQQFGYNSLEEYNMAASEVISVINSAAQHLDKVTRDTAIADTTAGGLGIASGILSGLGLVLIPFTAGGSLVLTATGVALGVGSAATSITSDVIQTIWDEKKAKEVENATESVTAETMALTKLLESYANTVVDLKIKLDFLGDYKALEYLKTAVARSSEIYSRIDDTIDVFQMTKEVYSIKPGLIGGRLDTQIAPRPTAPSSKFPSRLAGSYTTRLPLIFLKGGKSLVSVASKLSGLLSVVSVGFDIWDTINGAKKIKEGSTLAKEFRDLANNLASAKSNILLAYDIDVEQMFQEHIIGTRYDNKGRSEEWHRACFHGDMCVDLALLSYEVTGHESEQVCRRNGLYLLDVKSWQVSDIVRGFVSKFGRSTWFSNDSPYKEWAPLSPDYNDDCIYFSDNPDYFQHCAFFSQSDNFLVKDRNCFLSCISAVICA